MQTAIIILAVFGLIISIIRWLRRPADKSVTRGWVQLLFGAWRIALIIAALLCVLQRISATIFVLIWLPSLIIFELYELLVDVNQRRSSDVAK
jgi:hypothetical protein